jgi:tyrosyl-tRNA synthetase
LNSAKAILAYETTLLAHGREEAVKAHHAAASVFGARVVPKEIIPSSSMPRDAKALDDIAVPHSYLSMDTLQGGIPAFKLFHMVGLTTSGGAARRLIEQGGAYLNGRRIETFDNLITNNDMNNMELLLRAGKKRFHKIKIKK